MWKWLVADRQLWHFMASQGACPLGVSSSGSTEKVRRHHDLLGHGGSDSPSDPGRYRVENAVNDIAVALHKLGFSRACWLGYLIGGRIALVAALMPDVCCLVLEGAS